MSSEHPPYRGIQSHDRIHSHVVNRAEQYLRQDTGNGYPSRLDILYNSGHHPILRPISFTQRRTAESSQSQDEVLDQSTDEHRNGWKIFSRRISNSDDQYYPIHSPRTQIQQAPPQTRVYSHTASTLIVFRADITTNSPVLENMASDADDLQESHMGSSTGIPYTEGDPTHPTAIARRASQSSSSPVLGNASMKFTTTSKTQNRSPTRPPTPDQYQRIQFARIERLCIRALRWAWQREIELRVLREVNVEKSWVKFCCGETAIPTPRTFPVPSRGRASSRWEPYPSMAWPGSWDYRQDPGIGTGGTDRGRGRGDARAIAGTGINKDTIMTERQIFISSDLTEELGIRGFVRLITDLIAVKYRASPSAPTSTSPSPLFLNPLPLSPHPSLTAALPQNQHHQSAPSPAGLTLLDIPQIDYIGARLSNTVDAIRDGRILLANGEIRRSMGLVRELYAVLGFQSGVELDDEAS